jgi:hypothetical protein
MDDFNEILSLSRDLAKELSGHVFIGGVAVWMHAIHDPKVKTYREASHDADFMVSFSDLSELRERNEITINKRLGKHQLVMNGIPFDVYVERNNKLIVPYDQAFAHAKLYGVMRVACLEHLFALKLDALVDRRQSSKGDKDERDLVRIALVSKGQMQKNLVVPYLRPVHMDVLALVDRGQVFVSMSKGNVHEAKKIEKVFSDLVKKMSDLPPRDDGTRLSV